MSRTRTQRRMPGHAQVALLRSLEAEMLKERAGQLDWGWSMQAVDGLGIVKVWGPVEDGERR